MNQQQSHATWAGPGWQHFACLTALALILPHAACESDPGRPSTSTFSTGDTTNPESTTTTGDGDGDGNGGDGDGEPDLGDPPMVVSTSPAAGALAVDTLTPFVVTFAAPMDPATLTTNSGAQTCSGGLQVSDDGFATCQQMLMEVTANEDNTVFTFNTLVPLVSRRSYEMRLAAFVATASGAAFAEPYVIEAPFETRYSHTVDIDGENDFDGSDETFATSTPGQTAYVAWDSTHVYIGFEGSAIQADDPDTFVFAYIGGQPGSTIGVDYEGQEPTMSYSARFHPRWKTNGSYTNMQEFTLAWADSLLPLLGPEDYEGMGTFIEFRFARDLLGSPTTLPLVLGMLREGMNPSTFAAVPSSSFVDGLDPDFATHYEFQLDGSLLPVEHIPQ